MFNRLLFLSTVAITFSAAAAQSSSSPLPQSSGSTAAQFGSSSTARLGSSSTIPYNSAPAQTSVDIFVGPFVSDCHFAATVVSVDVCTTTLGLACTSGIFPAGFSQVAACDPALTWFATFAPNSYRALSQAQVGAYFSGAALLECSLDGTVSAVCTTSSTWILNQTPGSTSATATYTDAWAVAYQQVAVTAGAAKLAAAGTCTSTTSANAVAATAVVDVYKVLVVPGAAALLGVFA